LGTDPVSLDLASAENWDPHSKSSVMDSHRLTADPELNLVLVFDCESGFQLWVLNPDPVIEFLN